MQLTRSLFRYSVVLFVVFSVLVLWGFWQNYFSNPIGFQPVGESVTLVHLHGIAMVLWCIMLISQAYFIRTNRRDFHKVVGKSSYVIAPLVIASQLVILPGLLRTEVMSTPEGILPLGLQFAHGGFFMAVMFAGVVGFALAYRKNSAVHARLMLCTPIVILAPATDRITRNYFPQLLEYFPRYSGMDAPLEPFGAFLIGDILLGSLAVWDWRAHRRVNVFPLVLAAMLVFQITHYYSHRIPAWEALCNWYLGLPAS